MFTTVGNRGTMYLGLCLRVLILSALTVPIRAAQPAPETFTLTVPDGPTSTLSGSSVSLLCQVSPLFNAEPLEVRWYHSSNSHSLALLYKDHKIQEAPVDPRYRGRVSLTGGMERGNVSLTLERVTLEDRGEYVCQVTSEQWYEKASVFLTVNVTGREPVLSVAEARGGGGQVNVTCSSEGWSPQPKLTWRNKEGTEIRNEQEVLNTSDPHGLVSVSNWLLYASSYSDWLACTVYLSEEAKREGRILPHMNTAPTAVPGVSKEAFIVTLVLLILSLVIICALCSVILCKQRGSMWSSSQKSRNRSDQAELGQRLAETEHLIEGAENTVQNPTDQRAAGNDVHLEGAENTVLTPTEQKAAGKDVNLKGAENTVQTPTEQRAAGKDVHLKENAVLTPTEQKAAGKDVNLKENAVLTPTEQRAAEKELNLEENAVLTPTEQKAAGKDVNLEENAVLTPTEQRAAGNEVNLEENTVQTPTEQRAVGKDVHLKGEENTVLTPTEQRAAGNDVHLEENAVLTPTEQRAAEKELNLEGAENTVQNPTEQRAAGNDVHLEENAVLTPTEQRAAGNEVNLEENTVQTPTEQRAVGKDVHLKENTVQTPTEQRAVGKDVHLKGAENTVQTPTEQRAAGEELNLKDWHQVKIFKENILLDEKTAHPAIRVNHGKQRAHYVKEKDTEKPSRTHLHVFSKESFRSGQHYWEVKVKDGTAEKLSWYVGVARENVERRPTVPLTPQNGFWILSYDKGKCFHVNTDPQPPITVAKLTIVGVFLDCDRHTLSFYHVDTESLLYTFTDVKTSNYFPLLSPGQCDKIPIKIN
ncbi:E3 ubiquitin/ISG15 ligase TRIM25 isoform X35 [Oncorhynchus tshawytscha]|uniref:E3 ubiquitin/ISG15 ligase TRIM25 isoform X35 n=1 Tax=Oncorhynchus tshawytscha TaxID=74940 RepID=UPI001C3E2B07|nr:E3 ubiquitin/ISG15 ligase TRIM25 isoform X35 [Oncorhynchus tshawytscha]